MVKFAVADLFGSSTLITVTVNVPVVVGTTFTDVIEVYVTVALTPLVVTAKYGTVALLGVTEIVREMVEEPA